MHATLTLPELRRAAQVLAARARGQRVRAVVQPDAFRVVLTTFGGAPGSDRRLHVLLSCKPDSARVSLVPRAPAALPAPPAFAQYLRAHVVGARVEDVRLRGEDRQLAIELASREERFELLLAILGRRTNLWLLDAQGRVAAALRPPAQTRPELAPGEAWRDPGSRPGAPGLDRFAEVPDAELLEAIEARCAEGERREEGGALCRRTESALRKQARARERKLAKLASDLAEARAASRLEREGELLKGALARVRRGDRELRVRDWETGEEVAIALDPALSPAENLERIFRRYQKAVRRLARAGAQEQALRAAGGELEALTNEFRALAGRGDEALAELGAFAERVPVRRLLARYAPEAPPRRPDAERRLGRQRVPSRLAPRRYRSSDGLEIWVGRSDEGNDHLTTRLARGSDLFFHLEGAPGSHVVLRTEGRGDPPSESLLEACELAVHFSRYRDAGSADVHVVPIKNVRKPKGAKPGLVVVHGGRSVHLRRVGGRLQRVLAARIDD